MSAQYPRVPVAGRLKCLVTPGLLVLLAVWVLAWAGAPPAHAAIDPNQGPGGPILIVTSGGTGTAASPDHGSYYAEILRTEGLNSFAVASIDSVTAGMLAAHDVVLLARTPLTAAQATLLGSWVEGGGRLIAMAPDTRLNTLLGLTDTGTTLSRAYLRVNTSAAPGLGIVGQTMQFHGTARQYELNGALALATLYSSAGAATTYPAVTLRAAGSGQAAAFAYDLATSVVHTRQGNPAWAAQERDGATPIRSNDKFHGNASFDPQPDWLDITKVAIPQADEQQRFLANLILHMNAARKPLPRFWYLPGDRKAVVVMTGDDHGNAGTVGRFEQFKALDAANCSVANWECVRGTSYVYPSTPMSDAQVAQFNADGFEVGLHASTLCGNYTFSSLQGSYEQQVADFRQRFPGAGPLLTQRHHCIAWSDWTSGALVQLSHGMRLDTSYYYWPPAWARNEPGLFTGSALPMRFAQPDGRLVDVYMAATQMTDESGQAYPATVDALLDRALGPEGYYGVYTVNAHTDLAESSVADAVVASARARGVSVIAARQMLAWLDARGASSFGGLSFSNDTLAFSVIADPAAIGLQGMLPTRMGSRALAGITRGGATVPIRVQTIKGVEYALFAAAAGSYLASYTGTAPPTDTPVAPQVLSQAPAGGATGVPLDVRPAVVFSKAMDASTVTATTVLLRTGDASGPAVPATVGYDAATRTATLTPASPLAASTPYTMTVRGGSTEPVVRDGQGTALPATVTWSFTTGTGSTSTSTTRTAWDATAQPVNASVNDSGAVELGVKFRTSVDGLITGVRFYKGIGNTGTHVGNLWTSGGALLARATFTNETATGWQQVNFATPVPVTANTVYVASYFAPVGRYAGDNSFFANSGVVSGPLELLRNGVSGGNGVYAYGGSTRFPSSTYQSTNYWVDVVFSTASGGTDTTPPTVSSTSPANGSTGVAADTPVRATFSEALDAATLSATTFELRDAAGTLVAGSVAWDAATRMATFTPSSALSASASYTASLRGGATDPRIKDLAGNALAATQTWGFTVAASTGGGGGACANPANQIVAENCLVGSLPAEWDVAGAGDPSIQGFATDISVNRGSTVSFKVSSTARDYRFDIYRLGWYGGRGARKVATVIPSASLPQSQPSCLNQAATGLVDCGNWAVSGSWAVPADAVSGIYIARPVRSDTGGASHIVFIVRDDASTGKLLFQTADTTWQAYNTYGGNSLYVGAPAGRAYKVSYNRPFNTRSVDNGQDWLFNAEYPMLRWLEANGYDLRYITGVDSDRFGARLRDHTAFLSVGHDEYWSGNQRAQVEAARDAGVHLAFFSGNEVFWKTRWENSIDGSGTPYRTLVSYKETLANAKIDPSPEWTGTWRDPRFSPPADGGRPENALTGTIFLVNSGATTAIRVPEAEGKMRLWRNTSIATLAPGATATLPNGTLGYEWDTDADNGFRPPGLVRLSSTTVTNAPILLDFGSSYGSGTATHALTMYRHASGARVFGAGTVQWAWGLDATHDRGNTAADVRMQQATVNLLADMAVQPATLQAGLVPASASTDNTAPVSTITAPANGSSVGLGSTVTVSGTATDGGGGVVGAVEVSADGGNTWRQASGRASWSFSWTPAMSGPAVIKTRAVDDSGNLEVPGAGTSVTVGQAQCPCSIWPASAVPAVATNADSGSVNLGVKFRSPQAGVITGIRFYKGQGNTGTHIGALWTSGGQRLAQATFSGETATGWQQVNFATPVPIAANTVYVASYLAPVGRYAVNYEQFASASVSNGPLEALRNGVSGGNGVYAYGSSLAFPSNTYRSSNYWVDVVFTPTPP